MLSHIQVFVTLWITAHQAPLSIEFPGKNIRVGCHFLPTSEELPDPGIKSMSPAFLLWQVDSLPLSHLGSPFYI